MASERVSEFETAPSDISRTLRYLAITQAFGAQIQALAILLGERTQHSLHSILALRVGKLDFGIRRRIVRVDFLRLHITACRFTPLQAQIVRHAKHPAAHIRARFSQAQMPEQRQKNFLRDFFAVLHRKPEAQQIAQNRRAQLIEQMNDFLFERTRPISLGRRGDWEDRSLGDGIHCV